MGEERNLSIEYVETSKLVPYARNAKIHTSLQINQIAESIRQFGMCDPIAVWVNEYGEFEIVEGHGRLMALDELGIDMAPIIRLEHLSDEERRAYALVHNQTTLSSGFDDELLSLEMDELDFNWENFGFDSQDDDFDESDLDADDEKTNVVVSINCGDVANYESIKERLENLVGEIDGTMAVKMS